MLQILADFIKDCSSTPSINEKKVIIKKYYELAPEIKECFNYTYNPYLNYYLTNPVISSNIIYNFKEFTTDDWNSFKDLLNQANSRELTPANFQNKLNELFKEFSLEVIESAVALIKRDLACGINVKTINSVIPSCVPSFSVMLADKYTGKSELKFPLYHNHKYDGFRAISIHNGVEYQLLSREGRLFDTYTNQISPLLEKISSELKYNWIFDGEILAEDYQSTSEARAKNTTKLVNYHIFDVLSDNQDSTLYRHRVAKLNTLKSVIEKLGISDRIKIVTSTLVSDESQLAEIHNSSVKLGYEGSILKDPNSVYSWKRSKSWLKWKPTLDVDGYIVEVLEGTGRLENNFGSIVVEGVTESGEKFLVNCGSGFTDELRLELWNNRNSIVGKKVTLNCQEITKDLNGNYSVRFPVWKCFRIEEEQ